MKKLMSMILLSMIVVLSGCGTSTKYYTNKNFVSEDTETITYETTANNLNWGEYQKK